jgi:thiol-disulfide isomerase/thioredoxin
MGAYTDELSGLPTEFLSTPFGQSMRPQIDAMFRRTAPSEHPINTPSNTLPTPAPSGSSTPVAPNPLAAGLLNAVAQQATTSLPTPASTPPTPVSPLSLVSSLSHFNTLLTTHSALIVNFTNTPGCAPCRAIKPAYEAIAATHLDHYGPKGVRFLEVEMGVGEGGQIASKYAVRATPTFMFFKAGKKMEEMKGATKRELEVKVEEFLEACFPRHPHRKVYLPAVEGILKQAITAATTPNYPALISKLEGFNVTKEKVIWLKDNVIPTLEAKVKLENAKLDEMVKQWTTTSEDLLNTLQAEQTFPLIDLWRVSLLNTRISGLLALHLSPSPTSSINPLAPILKLAAQTLKTQDTPTLKPFLLTTLRLLTNLTASSSLANVILATPPSGRTGTMQSDLLEIVVESLLQPDAAVRSAAAGVAFNLGGWRHRLAKERGGEEQGIEVEWEVEVISAVVEAIGREADEDVCESRTMCQSYKADMIFSASPLGGIRLVDISIIWIYGVHSAPIGGSRREVNVGK